MGKVINVQMDEDFYNEIIKGGGSSSGSGDGEVYTYYDLTNVKTEDGILIEYFPNFCCVARYEKDNEIAIAPYKLLIAQGKEEIYIRKYAIDLNIKMVVETDTITIEEMFSMNGFDISPYSITKDQFYNLEA